MSLTKLKWHNHGYIAGFTYYEVETLFGLHPGEERDLKINRTIDKYNRVTGVKSMNIVMDNPGFLIHLKELMMKKHLFKD